MNTEAEAKEKWCPFVKFSDEGADAYSMNNRGEVLHRDVDPKTISLCIGSACMAWRWFDEHNRIVNETLELRKPAGEINPPFSNCPEGFDVTSHDSHGGYTAEREIYNLPKRGYCGAFGLPLGARQ